MGRNSARGQLLGELMRVGGDGSVGEPQDFGRAAVIGFDAINRGPVIALGEFDDVFKVRAPPRVDALGIVSDHHEVAMPPGQQIDQLALDFVGVLIFIDEDELKPPLLVLAHGGVFPQQLEPEHEQIVEVHAVAGFLARGVARLHLADLRNQLRKILKLPPHHCLHRLVLVGGQGEYVRQHPGFWETGRLHVDLHFAQAGRQQILRVLPVQNGKIGLVADFGGVPAQDPRANGMKGSAPEAGQLPAQQGGHAAHHFPGRLVGECQQEDTFRRNALFQEKRGAVRQRAGLARSRSGDDQRRTRRRRRRRALLFVQLLRVINPQIDRRAEGLQNISRDMR